MHGNTHDWISIYRHGRDGKPENPWRYIFLSYLREDPKAIYREIKKRIPQRASTRCTAAPTTSARARISWILIFPHSGFYCVPRVDRLVSKPAGDEDDAASWSRWLFLTNKPKRLLPDVDLNSWQ